MRTTPGRTGFYRLEAAAELTRLPTGRVRRYVRSGLVQPARRDGRTVMFGEADLARLRRIRRLAVDLGLDSAGVEVALRLIDQIEALQSELADARAKEARQPRWRRS